MKPNLQHAIERVERPGGSHEGVGRIFFFLEYGRCRTVARSLHEHKL